MDLSRRAFLAGSLTLGAGAAIGVTGCSQSSSSNSSSGEKESALAKEHNPSTTEEFDVVVVGSGTAGTAAALHAAELGKSVICVEKNTGLGGTSSFAEGFCGINTKFQAEQGITIDNAAVLADTLKYHHFACLGPVAKAFINNCGTAVDWLQDNGVEFAAVEALGNSYKVWHLPAGEGGMPTTVKHVLDILVPKAEELGVEFRTSTPMTDLAVEGDSVVGVYVGDEKEETLLKAEAVVLASGGYASNPELFEKFTGRPYDQVHVWGMDGRDGDGITAATGTAKAETHIPSAVMYHTGMFEGTTAFSDIPNFTLTMQPTLRLNAEGKRYFNESITADFSSTGNVLTSQTDNYVFFDEGFINHIETAGPFYPMPNLGAFVGQPFECREGIVSCEGIIQADTIEGLAKELGLDTDTVVASVEKYNGYCKSGVDEDFGKPAEQLLALETPPYYAGRITPTLFTTVGGLRTNEDMRVISTDGLPIPGLYACGGDASGIYGANYDVDVCAGSQQGWAVTSGYLAAERIAE
ncbi:MAG: FAD-dependent oxidoreductase [Raoultibacter sp.]